MEGRILTQIAVSFLAGIAGARYRCQVPVLAGVFFLEVFWNGFFRRKYFSAREIAVKSAVVLAALFTCFLGTGRMAEWERLVFCVEETTQDNASVTVAGTIYKKEEKNQQICYYLKDSYLYQSDHTTGSKWKKSGRCLILLDADSCIIGDTIKIKGTVKEFQRARNQGNFDQREYYLGKNLLFQVKADQVWNIHKQNWIGNFRENLYQLKKKIRSVYETVLPSSQAGVLSAMALGDKGILDPEIKQLYRQSGISHILAISGLHISLIGVGICRMLRKAGIGYGISGILAIILILNYGEIAGMEISTTRAILMFLLQMLGNKLGMAYDSVTALSFALLFQLWENPYALWYAGFQLSYLAVLAVVVAASIYQKQVPFLKRGWFLTCCIQLVTLPLTIWYFYEFPIYTIFINIILLPLLGVALASGLLGGLLGTAWLPGGFALLTPARLLLSWNEKVCRFFEKFPSAQKIVGRPELVRVLLYYLILGVCLYLMWYFGRFGAEENEMILNKGKRIHIRGLVRRLIPAVLPMFGLVVLLVFPKKTDFQLSFLDVGQGDGIYIASPEGNCFFVDGGSSNVSKVGEYRILSFLKYQGADRIDGWFVSHADEDHISGLLELWESGYPIRRLFMAEGITRDQKWETLIHLAEHYGTQVVYLRAGQTLKTGAISFSCVSPESGILADQERDSNDSSLVFLLQYGDFSAFLGGDISEKAELKICEKYSDLQVEVYKASHHGSNHSNSREILALTKPKVCVVSCAKRNSYGHPGKEAVARMEEAGSEVLYTMESGQITVKYDEKGIWIEEWGRK